VLEEYVIARRLEAELSKNRIFHLYLNDRVRPGVFGGEAARQYFGKSVGQSVEEVVRLTAVIPKPSPNRPPARPGG
jgi:membrane peptidoglycan carboxypeptidase